MRSGLKSELRILCQDVLVFAEESRERSDLLGENAELEVQLVDEVEEKRKEPALDRGFEARNVGDDTFEHVLLRGSQGVEQHGDDGPRRSEVQLRYALTSTSVFGRG